MIILPSHHKFFQSVDKNGPNGCWLWIGASFRGKMYYTRKDFYTRSPRMISLMIEGAAPITEGRIKTTCDNPLCVNPKHLIMPEAPVVIKSAYATPPPPPVAVKAFAAPVVVEETKPNVITAESIYRDIEKLGGHVVRRAGKIYNHPQLTEKQKILVLNSYYFEAVMENAVRISRGIM